jgi:hypothetical protein
MLLGFKQSSLEPGTAEVGFLLPRSLFNNHLSDLIRELRDVQRIIRAFSEVATGSVEEVEVRDISTSDPQFFFGLSIATTAALGAAVTWALNTWHQVEKIRKARVEVKNIDVFSESEIDSLFDSKIKEKINIAVEKKVSELVPDDGSPGRAKEQKTDLKWALESILAHVERGVTIEVRFLPPSPREATESADPPISVEPLPAEFKALQEIQRGLVFPPVKDSPIMQLPAPPRAEA